MENINKGLGWKIKYSVFFLNISFENELFFRLCDCPNQQRTI